MDKENWPEFPLWWLDKSKRKMEGLRDIANHLHTKTAGPRPHQGFIGEASEMDKQIINDLSDLRERVAHIADVLQSTVEIVAEDHWRRTHKLQRAVAWIRRAAKKCEDKLNENVFYRILAIASTLGLLFGIIRLLIHFVQRR